MFIFTFLVITKQCLTGSSYVLIDGGYHRHWQPYHVMEPQVSRFSMGYQHQLDPPLQSFNPYHQPRRFFFIPHPQQHHTYLNNENLFNPPTLQYMQQKNNQDLIYQRQSALFNILKCLVEENSKESCEAMINNVKTLYDSQQKSSLQVSEPIIITITPQVANEIEIKLKLAARSTRPKPVIDNPTNEEDVTLVSRSSASTAEETESEHLQGLLKIESKIIDNVSDTNSEASLESSKNTSFQSERGSESHQEPFENYSLQGTDMTPSINSLGKPENVDKDKSEVAHKIALFEKQEGESLSNVESEDTLGNNQSAKESIPFKFKSEAEQNVTFKTESSEKIDTNDVTVPPVTVLQESIKNIPVKSKHLENKEESLSNTEDEVALADVQFTTESDQNVILTSDSSGKFEANGVTATLTPTAEITIPPEDVTVSQAPMKNSHVLSKNESEHHEYEGESLSNTEDEALDSGNIELATVDVTYVHSTNVTLTTENSEEIETSDVTYAITPIAEISVPLKDTTVVQEPIKNIRVQAENESEHLEYEGESLSNTEDEAALSDVEFTTEADQNVTLTSDSSGKLESIGVTVILTPIAEIIIPHEDVTVSQAPIKNSQVQSTSESKHLENEGESLSTAKDEALDSGNIELATVDVTDVPSINVTLTTENSKEIDTSDVTYYAITPIAEISVPLKEATVLQEPIKNIRVQSEKEPEPVENETESFLITEGEALGDLDNVESAMKVTADPPSKNENQEADENSATLKGPESTKNESVANIEKKAFDEKNNSETLSKTQL